MSHSSFANLSDLRQTFLDGLMSKASFIATACEIHQCLWDYVEYIKACDIHRIAITPSGVEFELGEEHVVLTIPANESRVAPLEVLNFGAYEPVESRVMNLLAASSSVILDVGANIGYHSIRLALRESSATVYAFEPVPLFNRFLQYNVSLNSVGGRVQCLNCGLSNENGSFDFFITPRNGTNVSLKNVAERDDATRIIGLTMKMDDWTSNNSVAPGFIKIDVEGAEFLVLQGASNTIKIHKPKILAELLRKWSAPFGYHPNKVLEFMRTLGYGCWALGSNGVTPIAIINDDTEETNFAFLNYESHGDVIEKLENLDLP
jgi:FkbM family methyltransferase